MVDKAMMEHTPPQYLVRDPKASTPDEPVFVQCNGGEVEEVVTRVTRANPGEFVDIYQHISAARAREVGPLKIVGGTDA